MPEPILCKICGKRRARRSCPAVHGDICTICCGTEREVSLSCPLDCIHLREGHKHEKPVPISPEQILYTDIEVTEDFLLKHQHFLMFCAGSIVKAALETAGAVDTDVLAALRAAIQTQRTLESGLIYETKPDNLIAERVQRAFTESLSDYRKLRAEGGSQALPDSEIRTILVFLHRFGQVNLNGRPRGRLYLGVLLDMMPEGALAAEERASSIIL